MPARLEDLQQAVGRIELRQSVLANSADVHANEFKVFSQNGEDGIIQFLIRNVPIRRPIFIEFGVHDYAEANTRYLLKHNNWSGLVMDGSIENISRIKSEPLYVMHDLTAMCAFIDRDNINGLIRASRIEGDIGILSIDVDGNDYWIWEAIDCVSPRIVICEYNSLFGPRKKVTSLYDKTFVITRAHFSGLYWGGSIGAFDHLARKKGYSLVGSNSAGNNVFFVRNDVVGSLRSYSPEQAYVKSQFRISRDPEGNLTFLDFETSLELIRDLDLYEVDTGRNLKVKDLRD